MIPPSAVEPASSSSQFAFSLRFSFLPGSHSIASHGGLGRRFGCQVYGGATWLAGHLIYRLDRQHGQDTVHGGRLFYPMAFRSGRAGGQEDMSDHVGPPRKHWGDWQHEYTPVTFPPSFSGHFFGSSRFRWSRGRFPSHLLVEHWINTPSSKHILLASGLSSVKFKQ